MPPAAAPFPTSGCSAVYVAAINGHADAVACLASFGANLDAPSARDGLVPAYVAAVHGHSNVVAVLAQHGANMNAPSQDDDGDTRDSKWGWYHPIGTPEADDLTWRDPSYMGTAMLQP